MWVVVIVYGRGDEDSRAIPTKEAEFLADDQEHEEEYPLLGSEEDLSDCRYAVEESLARLGS